MSIKNSDNNYILKKFNMDIYEFSFASLGSEWKYKNALSASTRIYLPTLGEGFLDTINETIPILPGNIYLIPPMFNFSYRCENRLDKFFFQLTLEADKGFDVLQSVDKILVIKDEGECEALGKIFEKGTIEAAIQVENILFSIIVRALIAYGITLGAPRKTSFITTRALDYINSHLSAKLKTREIADALLISRLALSNAFTKDMNISIGKYIDERLMFSAERDLVAKDLSINEISEKYGFCDRFYFTRKFTEKFGKSPSQYLKNKQY